MHDRHEDRAEQQALLAASFGLTRSETIMDGVSVVGDYVHVTVKLSQGRLSELPLAPESNGRSVRGRLLCSGSTRVCGHSTRPRPCGGLGIGGIIEGTPSLTISGERTGAPCRRASLCERSS